MEQRGIGHDNRQAAIPTPRLPWHWGVITPQGGASAHGLAITRTVLTRASGRSLRLWLAQLRRAPYSYDWIDNLGRSSPQTPVNIELHRGDRIMYIFTITSVSSSHCEAVMTNPVTTLLFGRVHIRYDIIPFEHLHCLQYTMWIPAKTIIGRFRRYVLAWADLIMARKQLLTLVLLARQHELNASGERATHQWG